jgi:hypothetical protein
MAKSQTSKRDEQRDVSRRALIKWSVAAGAALGVSRARVFEILEKTAGKGVAEAAATRTARMSVHFDCGNGGLAWCTQMLPFPDIANAGNATVSWNFVGQQTTVAGAANKLVTGPATPGAALAQHQWSAFLCGSNNTHNSNAQLSTWSLGANSFPAIATALQAADQSVIPVIAVGGVPVGTAPGGATGAAVGNSTGMVGLFNSAASQAGGLLANMADAQLFKTQYDAFIQLNRAANRSTTKSSYTTAQGAAKFLGTNLASQLTVTADDLVRYNITGNTDSATAEIGKTLITTAKAFGMGLCNSITLPWHREDPHNAFDAGLVNTVPAALKDVLDGFFNDLTVKLDTVTMQPMINNLVMTFMGDTFKDPGSRPGWGDGTPNNTNCVWVFHPGDIKSGWYGNIAADGNSAMGFDANGAPATYNGPLQASMALSSIAYSIAIRDDRAIQGFTGGAAFEPFTYRKDM